MNRFRRVRFRALSGRSGHRFLVGFLLLFGVIALWGLTTPRFAAPDEPAQAVKAAATARGELFGSPSRDGIAADRTFRVPATIAHGTDPACFAFHPAVSARCAQAWRTGHGTVEATSYVGRYPPLYYVVVGLPSLVVSGTSVLLWMRLVSAALSALFLAAAFVSSLQVRGRPFVPAGVAVAATPMVLFLGGVINPSGLEISSALCLWTSGLALVTTRDSPHRRRLLAWTVASGATMVQLRGLSPLLFGVIAAMLLLIAGQARLSVLARRRDARAGGLIVGACAVFAVAWIIGMHSLRVKPSGQPLARGVSDLSLLRAALDHVGLDVRQLLGVFGWVDTSMPAWCYLVWGLAVVVLAAGVVVQRDYRTAAVVAALAFLTVAIPTVVAYSQARKLGIVGQGRYILPIAVGLPVLAAYAWSTRANDQRRRLLLTGAAMVLGAVQTSAFVQALHRYRTGIQAPIWLRHAAWAPPIPWLVSIAGFAALQAVFAVWWPRQASRQLDTSPEEAEPQLLTRD